MGILKKKEIANLRKQLKVIKENYRKDNKEANDIAQNFPWTNPLRLGLSLNYCVFYYEIKKNVSQAIKIGNTSGRQRGAR